MTKSNDKTNKEIISELMKQKGLDLSELSTELKKKSVQKMTFKERCEHINKMKLPFIILRSTPNPLLKKWLDMDLQTIIEVGNNFEKQSKNKNYYYNSCLHISHIKKRKMYDWGFITVMGDTSPSEWRVSSDWIDEIIEEGVIDLNPFSDGYSIGFGPKSSEKLTSLEIGFLEN
jgi:hypothetical protein